MSAFVVTLREGVEAALVVAIILAYLDQIGRPSRGVWVWAGTAAAVAASLIVGIVVWATVGALEGAGEQVAEGSIALAAAALLTWMIFWMARYARMLRGHLESRVDSAITGGGAIALALVVFVAVLREGVETALFLISTTVGTTSSLQQLVGGLLGLGAAIGIGYLFYRGSRRIDLRLFFRVTGVLLVLFAAGLIAKGVHEFQELGAVPTLIEHVWDLGLLDPESSTAGRFANSLLGWTPHPSLLMVLAYAAYLVPVMSSFLRMTATRAPARAAASP